MVVSPGLSGRPQWRPAGILGDQVRCELQGSSDPHPPSTHLCCSWGLSFPPAKHGKRAALTQSEYPGDAEGLETERLPLTPGQANLSLSYATCELRMVSRF